MSTRNILIMKGIMQLAATPIFESFTPDLRDITFFIARSQTVTQI